MTLAASSTANPQGATLSQGTEKTVGTLALAPKDDLPRLEAMEGPIEQRRYAEALPLLRDYLKDHPNSARGHYDLGYAFFRTHQIAESVSELSLSLKLDVSNAEAHKILALDCNIVGRYDLAERELEEAERLKPESAEIHYWLGRLYYTKGVYPLAKREFESAVRLEPSYMKAHNNLGLTMEVLGDTDAALKHYTQAVQLDEEQKLTSEWPYVYLSAFYNRQEKSDSALEFARKALETNPKSDLAYFQMAKAYRTQGEWEKSAEAARRAVAINPKTADFYYVLSYALRKLGKTQESQEAMEAFRKLQREDADRAERQISSKASRQDSMALHDDE
jgi:tetratricopeptide (TPR) repeat protein